jgi:anti-sigma factor RsiW
MACAELLRTQAFIDGELTGADAEGAERHVAACADCQAFCEDAAALGDDIRNHAQRYAAPDRLKLRVREAIAEASLPAAAQGHIRARSARWNGVLGGFVGGAGVSGLAAALLMLAAAPPNPDTLADRVVSAHTRALMSGGVIQVVSSDHHTVKPWFAGRIDISPPVHDFAAEGFKLTGGRVDTLAGQRAAVVVYAHGPHEIDLFVWADHGGRLSGARTRRGYHVLSWKHDDLDFAAVSDMQASELATFGNLIRGAQE